MAFFTGTLLASPIVRGSSGDTYGTHHSILGVGGFMEVETISERNIIPISKDGSVGILDYGGLSSGQRRYGMLVYVAENNTTYQLKPDYSTWTGSTDVQKTVLLEDNNNWIEYKNVSGLTSGFITGATNINSSFTGVTLQVLELNDSTNTYDGIFTETIDNYIIATDDTVLQSGTTKSYYDETNNRSWVYKDTVGWVLINNGDVRQLVGSDTYSTVGYAPIYTNTTWDSNNTPYDNGSIFTIPVISATTSGTTDPLTESGFVFQKVENDTLVFRNIRATGNTLNVFTSGDTIYISGQTELNQIAGINLSGGTGEVFSGSSGGTSFFRTLVASGGTIIDTSGNTVVIYSPTASTENISLDEYVTGATNLGGGFTTITLQVLEIDDELNTYDDFYTETLEYYNINSSGIILNGGSTKAYINPAEDESWIYSNNFNGITGWVFVNADVRNYVDQSIPSFVSSSPYYTNTTWDDNNTPYNNTSRFDILSVSNTTTITGDSTLFSVFKEKVNKNLELKTLKTLGTGVSLSSDANTIFISGDTSGVKNINNVGGGSEIGKDVLGDSLNLRTLVGLGDTQISQSGDTILITTNAGTLNTIIPTGVTSYTVTTSYGYVGCPSGLTQVFLPSEPIDGYGVTIVDIDGVGDQQNIQIFGTNGYTINGDTDVIINSDYGSIKVEFNGQNWTVVAFTP